MRYLVKRLCTVFFILLCSVTVLSAQHKDSVQGDYEALQALYNSTQGQGVPTLNNKGELPSVSNSTYPYMYMINGELHALDQDKSGNYTDWVNFGEPWPNKTGWDTMTPETMGDAIGIETDANGRVISIDMWRINPRNNGSGHYGNTLVGELPVEINNLHNLQYFAIKQNFFYGKIPDISNWTEVTELSFAGQDQYLTHDENNRHQWHESNHWSGTPGKKVVTTNRFRDVLPASIDGFQNLTLFEFRHQFLLGPLPYWSNLPSIRGLFIDNAKDSGPNSIAGHSIPDSWSGLTNIIFLKIGNLGLVGDFPQSINENWENLSHISLSGNIFSGPVPEFLKSRDKRYVSLRGNNFTGGFPSGYFNGDNSELNKWQIGGNNLSGELPQTVPSPSYPKNRTEYWVTAPGIGNNNFTGLLPEWIQSMRDLQTWYIVGNSFEGPFPKTVAEQDRLKTFYISDNNFSGPLPDVSWGNRPNPWVYMSGNNFEGEIPDSWISLFQNDAGEWYESLGRIYMNNNNLSGRIPDWPLNVDIDRFYLSQNRYTFVDIGPVYDALKAHMGDGFRVGDQKPFGREQNRTMPEGGEVIFDLSEYDYTNNSYQWLKDDTPINGENSPILKISNVSSADVGSYVLEVTNSDLAELGPHQSQPIHFQIGEDDGWNSSGEGSNDSGSSGDNGSEDGGSSTEQAVFPAAPGLISPNNLENNVSVAPQLQWSSVEGADYYILHMSRSKPGGMVLDVTTEDTTYTPSEILGDKSRHQWRVRAVKDGEMGKWADIYYFDTIDAELPPMADLTGPDHKSEYVSIYPELEWEPVEADRFRIRIIHRESSELIVLDESKSTLYTPVEALEFETAYIWQVKSIIDGIEGAWGPKWEFSTGEYTHIVGRPVLLSPDQGEDYTTLTPTFEWQGVDADHYIISVSEEPPSNAKILRVGGDESPVIIYEETGDVEYRCTKSLDPDKHYYWRVKAVKDAVEGEWSEIWEFKTQGDETVNIDEKERPSETTLSQNYPNPFNPSTQIEFTLSEAQNVSMKVYNMAGREVANLLNEGLNAGSHSITFNAGHLSSGIYFYRYVTQNQSFTKKMTIVK